jgi:hypothetical protein
MFSLGIVIPTVFHIRHSQCGTDLFAHSDVLKKLNESSSRLQIDVTIEETFHVSKTI